MSDDVRRDPDPEGEREGARDWSFEDVRDAGRAAQDAAREARRLAREARRSHRIRVSGQGMRVGGIDIDGMALGDFAKGFMKDFMKDAGGDAYSETVQETFEFERMPRLRIRNVSGETVIHAGESGKITVLATKRVAATSEERAKRLLQNLEIRMERDGDELRVEPHLYEQERSWVDLFRGRRFRVDFDVTVPPECAVDAQTVSGHVAVRGVTGPQDVQTVSGGVVVEDAQGPLRLKSVSGDVDVRRYVGHVEGNTVSGDVTFDAARIRSLALQTVSGDLEMKGTLEPARAHRMKTISGDVELDLTEPDLLIDFRTTSGDLDCEVPAQVDRHGRREYAVSLGAARGRAVVKTVSGDLSICSSGASVPGAAVDEEPQAWNATAEPAPPDAGATAPTPRAEVRDLLERVAKGEIGVDDAAARLDDARRAR